MLGLTVANRVQDLFYCESRGFFPLFGERRRFPVRTIGIVRARLTSRGLPETSNRILIPAPVFSTLTSGAGKFMRIFAKSRSHGLFEVRLLLPLSINQAIRSLRSLKPEAIPGSARTPADTASTMKQGLPKHEVAAPRLCGATRRQIGSLGHRQIRSVPCKLSLNRFGLLSNVSSRVYAAAGTEAFPEP